MVTVYLVQVTKRARSSSIVSVQEIPENYDDTLDQGALNNVNADWVNYKGRFLSYAWSMAVLCWECSERPVGFGRFEQRVLDQWASESTTTTPHTAGRECRKVYILHKARSVHWC